MMKHCPDCGFALTRRTKFCPECGTRLQPDPLVVDATAQPPSGSASTTGLIGIGWQPPDPSAASTPTRAVSPSKRSSRTTKSRKSGSGQQQAFVSPAPGSVSPSNASHSPLSKDRADVDFVGEVQHFQHRTEQQVLPLTTTSYSQTTSSTSLWSDSSTNTTSTQYVTTTSHVWTFRVVRYDVQGNALPPIAVELRAGTFEGGIKDGDMVQVPAAWRAGQIVKVERVYNLTTSSNAGAPIVIPIPTPVTPPKSDDGGMYLAIGAGIFFLGILFAAIDPKDAAVWFFLGLIIGGIVFFIGVIIEIIDAFI